MRDHECEFCAILHGDEPAKIIHNDEASQLALIQSLHPEGAIHWLAVPYEHVDSIETLVQKNRPRFQELMDFALAATKAQEANHPDLRQGFTVKMHIGPFETVRHAKLHVLSVE